MGMNDQHYTGF